MTNELQRAFDRASRAAEERSWHPGRLGLKAEDGSIRLTVAGRRNYVYVRRGGEGQLGITQALNLNCPLRYDLPVEIRQEKGEWVCRPDALRLASFWGTGTTIAPIAPHAHVKYSGLEYYHEALFLEMGVIKPAGGMLVSIGPMFYYHNGAEEYWPGGTIDLTSNKPATPGQWRWVKVGINPTTNALVATNGTAQSTASPLDVEDLAAIAFTGIPCGAVKVRNADTALTSIDRYADIHEWFQSRPASHAASHQHSGADEVATATPGANAIPKAGAGGTLNDGWIATTFVGSTIHAAAAKTTPVDADTMPLIDSADSNLLKKVTWANIKATLLAYFDTLYVALTGAQSIAGVKTFSNGISFGNETLSAYDEGTWSPAINGSASNPTVSYNFQVGRYTRIGNVYFFVVTLAINTISGGSGDIRITLPTTTLNVVGSGTASPLRLDGVNLTGTPSTVVFIPVANTNYGNIRTVADDAASTVEQISALTNGDTISFSGLFFV